jgi:porphobilinogen deaminase
MIDRNALTLDGLVANPDGSQIWRDSLSGTLDNAEQLGSTLATTLIERGAVFL